MSEDDGDGDGYVYEPELMTEAEAAKLDVYYEALHESDGFDVPYFPDVSLDYGLIRPLDAEAEADTIDVTRYTKLGIHHYKQQPQGTSLELVDIVKVMMRYTSPIDLYITFTAKEAGKDQIGTYQTLVVLRCPDDETYVDFTRPKPESQSRAAAAAAGPLGGTKGREMEAQDVEEKQGKRCKC